MSLVSAGLIIVCMNPVGFPDTKWDETAHFFCAKLLRARLIRSN